MPLRIFSRSSPKKTANNSADASEPSGKDAFRPPLFPLQEVSWNSFTDGKNDLLSTPRDAMKWLSSTPLPDPPFFESQENFPSVSPEKALLSEQSNLKVKTVRESKLRLPNQLDAECATVSSRSSASSAGMLDTCPGNYYAEHRNTYATPQTSSCDSDTALVAGITPVARSLKYGPGSNAQTGSCTSIVHAMTPTVHAPISNSCAQSHFEIEEDPTFWKDHNVQVVIRLRPLNSTELATQGQSRCVRQDSAHALTWTGHPESRFTFDCVACESITQEKMFKVAGQPMVDNCLTGYNSCMFAYGQTGSGKTYTMLGDLEGADHRPSNDCGMTPRVFEYLFARIGQEEEARAHEHLKFVCKCSFLEIYNEQILDLLEPSNANLQMREDARKGVYVENLSEVEAKNVQDVIGLLLQGAVNRKVAATNMNRESSRSHSVFTCVIESKWINQSVTNSRYGRLNLVDLAGSERQKSSGAEGERLKEAANINKSLSTLGLVIMSLVDIANGKQRHVPYRDSKLTFLLHDSLGGNSKTTIIANISPSNCCAMETLSTLKFAQRAKFIRNNAIVNENNSGDVMALRLQIQQLKQEVNRLRLQGAMGHGGLEMLPEGVLGSEVNGLELSNIGHSAYSLEAWDSLKALASPTFSSKKRKELEYALSGSLRREQAGEARIRQLHAEIEQFKRLVKQREEDSQCGKMMLRFREDKIKRLEAALGGVISTDTYLMEERNSLLEEVNILRTRLERNPEVTRFAMENIRLLEELRRFQDFYEAGERDMMAEEISILRDQLLEALDWKLMHEQDSGSLENAQAIDSDHVNKENDSLQLEVDRSRLEKTIETVEVVASMQAELIAMREAVAAATKGEFEARERVSLLTGEIEALQKGLKELHEENARLCGMYQSALSEKDALIEEFKNEWNMTKEEKEGQINELRIALQHAEKTLHAMSHQKEEEPGIQNAHKNLQEENAKLRNMVEQADSTKEAEIYSLKNALQAAEETIRIMALSSKPSTDSQDGEQMKRNMDPYHLGSASPSSQHAEDGRMFHDKDKGQESLEDAHARASEIEVLLKELKDLQAENARISAMYQSALAEKSSTEVDLHLFHQIEMEGKDAEIEELRSALQAAQLSLSNLKDSAPPLSQHAVDGGLFHDKDKGQESLEDTHAKASEIEVLLKELRDLQDENARISATYQSALAEKSSTEVELHLFHQIEMEGKDAEIQELRSALQAAQLLSSNLKLQEKENEKNNQTVSQELTSLFRCMEHLTCLLQAIDGTVMGMMQWIERSTDGIKCLLEKVMASTSEFNLEKDSLEAGVDRIVLQMSAMFLDMDESEQKVQAVCTDLEHTIITLQEAEQKVHDLCMGLEDTKLRLKDAEQARDDVCLLSSVEKSTWMQDQKVLQERLDNALQLLSLKDKMLQDGISAAESKLELLGAKITELSTVVDKKMLSSSNQIFRNLDTSRDSSSRILKIENDEGVVENSLNMVQFKLKQAENKVNAIKLVLNRLSSAKRAWFSREERLHEHLQNLNNVVLEKEAEVNNLEGEKEKLVICLDELLKEEKRTLLESANLKERLQVSEEGLFEVATGQTSSMSMLQLLRGQEEKATLRSVVDSLHEKLETVRADIEHVRGQIDKIDTALMFSQVDLEAAISTLQEAEAEMEETKKEKEALLEAEAEGRAEFELLTAEYKKVADEERELEEQMKGCKTKSSLDELKDSLHEKENQVIVAHSKFAEDKPDATDCSKEQSGMLAEYVVDIREVLLDVKLSFENLGKIVDHVKES